MAIHRRRLLAGLAAVAAALGAPRGALAGILFRARARRRCATTAPAPCPAPVHAAAQAPAAVPTSHGPILAACHESIATTTFGTTRTFQLGTTVWITVNGLNFNRNPVTIQDSCASPKYTWTTQPPDPVKSNGTQLVFQATPSGSAGTGGTLTVTVQPNPGVVCTPVPKIYAPNWITYTA
jgi:hypothetical protein